MKNSGQFTSKRTKTHGMSKTRVYGIWEHVVSRGTGKAGKDVNAIYFDRGIGICDRWLKFENFYFDMGDPPDNYSIDRIDSCGNYEPDNCRWADKFMQANNKRSNRILTIDGVSRTVCEWAKLTGIKSNTITYRLIRGWSPEKSIQNKKHKSVSTEKKELREISCLFCGNKFIPRPAQVKVGHGRYCSQKCNGASRKGRCINEA